MQTSTTYLDVANGVRLFVHEWLPDEGTPVGAVVQIAHGMAEHSARYARLAETLTRRGFAVYADDHRGHGRSAREAEHGFLAENHGWTIAVADVGRVREHARAKHPGVPYVLCGHSMGSNLTLHHVCTHPRGLDLVVLSGPTGKVGALIRVLGFVAALEQRRQGPWGRSKILNAITFGAYNLRFRPNRTPFDWLSRDSEEVDRYAGDPWCGFVATNQMWRDIVDGQRYIENPVHLSRIPKTLPIYVVAGTQDPVGGNGKQVQALVNTMRDLDLNVDLRLWADGRHELLNEINRDEVTDDLVRWIETHLPDRPS